MKLPGRLQGRSFGAAELAEIQGLLRQSPPPSRYALSRQLATQWQWRSATGQLKDMAARTLLLKLEQQGWIELPPRRRPSPTRSGRAPRGVALELDPRALETELAAVRPLQVEEVSRTPAARARLEAVVERYHYLGYRSRVGQNLQYWVASAAGRPLGCVVFGAAAWHCAVRDQWIGWKAPGRAQRLSWVLNNTRFLILPWVRVPQLASHLLGLIARRVRVDWQAKYQQPLELLETFVDRERFAGTCYQAANWIALGSTCGRGRQGQRPDVTSRKEVYVLPLHPSSRQRLCAPELPESFTTHHHD